MEIITKMDEEDVCIRPTMDNLMKKYGLKSFSELKDKVLDQLDEKTKKQFLEVHDVTHHAKHNIVIISRIF
jgi:hypothetical protein